VGLAPLRVSIWSDLQSFRECKCRGDNRQGFRAICQECRW